MKASELRLENLVFNQDGTLKENPIGEPHRITTDDFKWAELYLPIPLTEEWLERFGFFPEQDAYVKQRVLENHIDRLVKKSDFWVYEQGFEEFYEVCTVQWVHELQNLYFALTGEELELI